jgi:CheY-like chemotaxis protein
MEIDTNSRERRSFPRTGLSLPVQLTAMTPADPDAADPPTVHGVMRDVSRGGCAVVADAELRERTRCIARFMAATGRLEPDTVWAEVRRVSPQSGAILLGLEFDTPLETLRISAASVTTTESPATGRPRVLIVDDQPGIRGLLSRYLGERGFDVETAADGEEAFRKLNKRTPEVMLVDLFLPRLNGHDLLRRMQDLEVSVPLIYTMSGYADTADAQECLRLGASDHLLKPLDLDHLHRNIRLRLGALQN